jgi:hypothetical protein
MCTSLGTGAQWRSTECHGPCSGGAYTLERHHFLHHHVHPGEVNTVTNAVRRCAWNSESQDSQYDHTEKWRGAFSKM